METIDEKFELRTVAMSLFVFFLMIVMGLSSVVVSQLDELNLDNNLIIEGPIENSDMDDIEPEANETLDDSMAMPTEEETIMNIPNIQFNCINDNISITPLEKAVYNIEVKSIDYYGELEFRLSNIPQDWMARLNCWELEMKPGQVEEIIVSVFLKNIDIISNISDINIEAYIPDIHMPVAEISVITELDQRFDNLTDKDAFIDKLSLFKEESFLETTSSMDDQIDPMTIVQYYPIESFSNTQPDLSPIAITFSNANPDVMETITINTTVTNTGWADANNILVQFWDYNPIDNYAQIGGDHLITFLPANGTTWLETVYSTGYEGVHNISVIVDPYNNIAEVDDGNNKFETDLMVGGIVQVVNMGTYYELYNDNVLFQVDSPGGLAATEVGLWGIKYWDDTTSTWNPVYVYNERLDLMGPYGSSTSSFSFDTAISTSVVVSDGSNGLGIVKYQGTGTFMGEPIYFQRYFTLKAGDKHIETKLVLRNNGTSILPDFGVYERMDMDIQGAGGDRVYCPLAGGLTQVTQETMFYGYEFTDNWIYQRDDTTGVQAALLSSTPTDLENFWVAAYPGEPPGYAIDGTDISLGDIIWGAALRGSLNPGETKEFFYGIGVPTNETDLYEISNDFMEDTSTPIISSTIPSDGATGIGIGAGTYVVQFSEAMDTSFTGFTTDLPGAVGSWLDVNTFHITYSGLVESMTYYVDLNGHGHQDISSNALGGDMYMDFTTGDFTPPTIVSTTPVDGATDVSVVAGTYIIDFSEPMDTSNTGFLTDLPGAIGSWLDTDTFQISYTALSEATTYYMDLTGMGHQDLDGMSLVGDIYKIFTAIGSAPIIISTFPVDGAFGVPIIAGIYVTMFSEPMNTLVMGFTTNLPGAVGSWDGGMWFNITYTALITDTTYYVDFMGHGHEDLAAVALTGDIYKTFTTTGTAPVIISTLPSDGATSVSVVAGTYIIDFSEPMDTSITAFLTDLPGVAGAWNGNQQFDITYAALAESTTYYINLAGQGHQDLTAEPLIGDMYKEFTTGDFTPPTIISTTPADGASGEIIGAGIYIVEFSEAMDTSITTFLTDLPGSVGSWQDADTFQIIYTTLTESTIYFVDFTGQGHQDITSNGLTGDMYMDFTTGDFTPPVIISTTPADGTTGVGVGAGTYVVQFSEAMDTSVTSFTTDLPGAVGSWDGTGMWFNITHNVLFTDTTYYVNFTGQGHQDLATNVLAGDMNKTFTTIDLIPPTIISTTIIDGASGVSVSSNTYVVQFSEPMDTSVIAFLTNMPGAVGSWSSNQQFDIAYIALSDTTTYYVDFTGHGHQDLAANALSGDIYKNFTTGDFTNPYISSTIPADGAINVLVPDIVITFNEAMNSGTVIFTVTPNPGGLVPVWSGGNTILTISHNSFVENTLYQVQVITGNDLAGYSLVAGPVPNPWTFTSFIIDTEITIGNPMYVSGNDTFVMGNTPFSLIVNGGDMTGINRREYRINGGGWVIYSVVFNLSTYDEGFHTIDYRSIGVDGTTELYESLVVNLDKTPPTVNLAWSNLILNEFEFNMTLDDFSGIAASNYSMDGGPDTPFLIGNYLTQDNLTLGYHTIKITVTDWLGFSTIEWHNFTFAILSMSPSNPTDEDEITFECTFGNDTDVSSVILRVREAGSWTDYPMASTGDHTFKTTSVGPYAPYEFIEYYLWAFTTNATTLESAVMVFNVSNSDIYAPTVHEVVTHPQNITAGSSVLLTASILDKSPLKQGSIIFEYSTDMGQTYTAMQMGHLVSSYFMADNVWIPEDTASLIFARIYMEDIYGNSGVYEFYLPVVTNRPSMVFNHADPIIDATMDVGEWQVYEIVSETYNVSGPSPEYVDDLNISFSLSLASNGTYLHGAFVLPAGMDLSDAMVLFDSENDHQLSWDLAVSLRNESSIMVMRDMHYDNGEWVENTTFGNIDHRYDNGTIVEFSMPMWDLTLGYMDTIKVMLRIDYTIAGQDSSLFWPGPIAAGIVPLNYSDLDSFLGYGNNTNAPNNWADVLFSDSLLIGTISPLQNSIYSVGEQLNFEYMFCGIVGDVKTNIISPEVILTGPDNETIIISLSLSNQSYIAGYPIPLNATQGTWNVNISATDQYGNYGQSAYQIYFGPPYDLKINSTRSVYLLDGLCEFYASATTFGRPNVYLNDTQVSINITIYDMNATVVLDDVLTQIVIENNTLFYFNVLSNNLGTGTYLAVFNLTDVNGTYVVNALSFSIIHDIIITLYTDQTEYNRDENVNIWGSVKWDDGTPVENFTVALSLDVKTFQRRFHTTTDSNGSYTYLFNPLSQEAGIYDLSASASVGEFYRCNETSFVIHGLLMTPWDARITMPKNADKTFDITLKNIGETTLTGLAVTIDDPNLGDGVSCLVNDGAMLTTLTPEQETQFQITVQTSLGSPSVAYLFYNATSSEGELATGKISLSLIEASPVAQVTPQNIRMGVNPGGVTWKEVSINNLGYGSLSDIFVTNSSLDWIHPDEQSLGSLEFEEETSFKVVVEPKANLSVGIYEAEILVQFSNHSSISINLFIEVVSSETGSLEVNVDNTFGECVESATVMLINKEVWTLTYSGVTNATGYALITDISAGVYDLHILAEGHQSHSEEVLIEPGITPLCVNATLTVDILSYSWEVIPITIDDEYFIEIDLTFETDILVPVLMPTPSYFESYVDRDYVNDNGYYKSRILTLYNTGLVSIFNVSIDFAYDDHYYLGSMIAFIEEIPAQSSVSIPIEFSIDSGFLVDGRHVEVARIYISGDYIYWDDNDNMHHGEVTARIPYFVTEAGDRELIVDPAAIFVVKVGDLHVFEIDIYGPQKLPTINITNPADSEIVAIDTHAYGFSAKFETGQLFLNLLTGGLLVPLIGPGYHLEIITGTITEGEYNPVIPDESFGFGPLVEFNVIQTMSYYEQFFAGQYKLEVIGDTLYLPPNGGHAVLESFSWDFPPDSLLDVLGVDLNIPFMPEITIGAVGFQYQWELDSFKNLKIIPLFILDTNSPSFIVPEEGDYDYDGSGVPPPPPPPPPVWDNPTTIINTVNEKVKLRISQRLTFEREAFQATMEVQSKLTSMDIENISVSIHIKDANGTDMTDKFFIIIANLDNIANISGSGILSPQELCRMEWLIIPKPGAGGLDGILYYVYAQFSSDVNGVNFPFETQEAEIFVNPTPYLILDYFIPQNVTANVPYRLGVRVSNVGNGTAYNMEIVSAQPIIWYNPSGLLVDFTILGSAINGMPVSPTLALEFGDIAPGQTIFGYWEMISTLDGEFTEFNVSCSHAPHLGGEATSLVSIGGAYIIVNDDVYNDAPGYDDSHFDMLIDEDTDDMPDIIIDPTSGNDTSVTCVNYTVIKNATSEDPVLIIELNKVVDGWIYTEILDPFNGTAPIINITREDGKVILLNNYWRKQLKVALLDDPATRYTIYYQAKPPAPVTDLHNSVVGNDVLLEWTASNSTDIDHYNIYVSTDAYNFNFLTPFASTTLTSYSHIGGALDTANNYYYIVRAVNIYGSEENNTFTVGKYVLSLDVGMNLISTPLLSWDTTLNTYFDSNLTGGANQGQSDKIYKWDNVNNTWLVAYMYEVGDSEWDGTWLFVTEEFTIKPDVGYWVWIRDDLGHPTAMINITGELPGGRNVPISVGWNLVGYTSLIPMTLEYNATDISGLYGSGFTGGLSQGESDLVFCQDGQDGMGWKVQYMYGNITSPLDGTWLGTTFDLAPGKGYWIEVRETHTGFVWTYGG